MPHPLSNDLRVRVVAFVEAGGSRNEAAAHFATSVSFAVNLMKLWRQTGSVEPRPSGGFRHGKIGPHKDFILAVVAEKSDITMPELAKKLAEEKGVKVDPSRLSNFLIGCGFSYKKNAAGKRTRQARGGQGTPRVERRPPAHHARSA
jgi:transposase